MKGRTADYREARLNAWVSPAEKELVRKIGCRKKDRCMNDVVRRLIHEEAQRLGLAQAPTPPSATVTPVHILANPTKFGRKHLSNKF